MHLIMCSQHNAMDPVIEPSHPTTATKEALLTFKLITLTIPSSTNFAKSTSSSATERLEVLRQVENVLGAYMLCQIISTSLMVSLVDGEASLGSATCCEFLVCKESTHTRHCTW